VSSLGNVGIGTTTPTYRLDVQGSSILQSSISAQGAFNINPLSAPVAISNYTLSAGTSLGVGQYYYFVTYVTAVGETNAGSILSVTTTAGNTTVNLTGIPVSSDPRVTARKIYRTKLNFTADNEYFLVTLNNNTATTYTDSIADTSLTGANLQQYKVNTTSRYFTVSGAQGMILDTNLTTLGLNAGNAIIASSGSAVRTVLIGTNAGRNITTGTGNVIVGFAGGSLTTGGSNSLLGDLTGYLLTTGNGNTIVGSQAGRYLTTGAQNTLIGEGAGSFLANGSTQFTIGTSNVAIGNNARMFAINDTNSIVIGSTSQGLGSNTVVLGNDSITTTALKGNVGIGTTVPTAKLQVKGSGTTSATTAFRVENANTSGSVVVLDDGNVGIGITTPSQKLHVVGTTFSTNGYKLTDGFSIGALGQNSAIRFNNGDIFINNTSAVAYVRFDTTNNRVGIGTTTPSASLQVNGDTILSSSLYSSRQSSSLNTGDTLLYQVNTGSYTAGFFDYYATSGSNGRAGTIMSFWLNGSIVYSDNSTTDIGTTLDLAFSMSISESYSQLYVSASTDSWTVKTTFRTI
jgi:hypothetical protein